MSGSSRFAPKHSMSQPPGTTTHPVIDTILDHRGELLTVVRAELERRMGY
jgi:hypothetical protein